ncbi:MAG TPA: OmpH family outer membrane protein [Gammaproteobacteria bacterium]|jgi:outer membrane protein|nr:OmpH family outer membrane protein [Gammaproteobacteria bacterium]
MRASILLTSLLIGVLAAGTAAAAANTKIGVIDVNYIVAHSKRGQAAKAALEALYNKKKAALDKEKSALDKQKTAIEKSKDKKSKATQKLIADYQQAAGKFQHDVQASQSEVGQRRDELLQPIGDDLKKVISNYAKDHGYALILNATTDAIAFASDSYNLNDEIVKALNSFEGEK